MRYRCLILDHDDTAVRSTEDIHYPSYLESMRRLRPGVRPLDVHTFLEKNFDPGIVAFLTDELGMTAEELQLEYRIWRSYTTSRVPAFFQGLIDFLMEYKRRGGKIAVISHSEEDVIRRHYREQTGGRLTPDCIMGWHEEEGKRKPSPYPVEAVLETLGLDASEALVVDDLKPGVTMARTAGVAVAAAGWGHEVSSIAAQMREMCDVYLESVEQLRQYVLDDSGTGDSGVDDPGV
ncbi:MAG: HAD family hydrolase [Spirochaetaceae bacterium]